LLLLPDTSQAGAVVLAERIRLKLETTIMVLQEQSVQITMTFGVSEYNNDLGIEATINRADMALLGGKKDGRNRVAVAHS